MDTHIHVGRQETLGGGVLALAGVTAWVAHGGAALLWPVAFGMTWLGGYLAVRQPDPGRSGDYCLGPHDRAARGRLGRMLMAGAVLLAALSGFFWPPLWPLVVVTAWFGVSFLVAASTGYPGCPEIGAIPSLILGRSLATRCSLPRTD